MFSSRYISGVCEKADDIIVNNNIQYSDKILVM